MHPRALALPTFSSSVDRFLSCQISWTNQLSIPSTSCQCLKREPLNPTKYQHSHLFSSPVFQPLQIFYHARRCSMRQKIHSITLEKVYRTDHRYIKFNQPRYPSLGIFFLSTSLFALLNFCIVNHLLNIMATKDLLCPPLHRFTSAKIYTFLNICILLESEWKRFSLTIQSHVPVMLSSVYCFEVRSIVLLFFCLACGIPAVTVSLAGPLLERRNGRRTTSIAHT